MILTNKESALLCQSQSITNIDAYQALQYDFDVEIQLIHLASKDFVEE